MENGEATELKEYSWSGKTTTAIENPVLITEDLLRESILLQLQSSTPLGLMYSGGVDSSLILALAAEEGYELPCYIVQNDKDKIPIEFARSKNCPVTTIPMDQISFDDFIEWSVSMDQPIADSAGWLTNLIASQAGDDGFSVLLSGAGADELFGGYNRHKAIYHYSRNKWIVDFLKQFASILPYSHVLKNIDSNFQITFLNFVTMHHQNLRKRDLYEDYLSLNTPIMDWALDYDINNYLPNDVLKITDQQSMQEGIEIRMPFLDNELLNLSKSIEPQQKMRNGPKWILKEILAKYQDKKYRQKKKVGFGIEMEKWLFNNKDQIRSYIRKKNLNIYEHLTFEKVEETFNGFEIKPKIFSQSLYSILVLATWIENKL